MTRTQDRTSIPHRMLQVGEDTYPILGADGRGWNLDSGDLGANMQLPYTSIDELFFALVNFKLHEEGRA
jgi:hypothetical protein